MTMILAHRGLRENPQALFGVAVLFTSVSMVAFIHEAWFTTREPHIQEAFCLAWAIGVVDIPQSDIRRCVFEASVWIHRVGCSFSFAKNLY
jgi:hypothetical protein